MSRWTFLRPVGKHGLDCGLDWTGLGGNFSWGGGGCIIVLVCKKYRVFNLSPTGYIFSFGVGGGGGEGSSIISTLLFFVDWSTAEDVSSFGQHRKFPPHEKNLWYSG